MGSRVRSPGLLDWRSMAPDDEDITREMRGGDSFDCSAGIAHRRSRHRSTNQARHAARLTPACAWARLSFPCNYAANVLACNRDAQAHLVPATTLCGICHRHRRLENWHDSRDSGHIYCEGIIPHPKIPFVCSQKMCSCCACLRINECIYACAGDAVLGVD